MREVSRVWVAVALVVVVVAFAESARAPDTTPPTIWLVYTGPFGPHRVGEPVEISAQVTDDTGVAGVTVNVTQPDGTSVNATMILWVSSTYRYTQNWTQVGEHPFTTWAVDTAGNNASRSDSFTVYPPDTVPPTIADLVAYPATQAAGGEVTIAGSLTDDQRTAGLWINFTQPDGVTRWCPHRALGWGDIVFSYDFWCTQIYVQVGLYTFLVTAFDEAGNTASATGSFRIVGAGDTTPPTIAGAGASPGSQVAGGSVAIHATITDDLLLASVSLDITQPDGVHVIAPMTATDDLFVFAASWVQVGLHTFRILAVDGAGNPATAAGAFEIRSGDVGPTIAAVRAMPASQAPGGTVTVSATVMDDTGLMIVSVNITGPSGASVNATMTALGSTYAFTAAWDEVGAYSFTIWAADVAGTWTSASGLFRIDVAAPTPPTILHAPPPAVYTDDPLRIDAFVTDDEGVQEVRLVYTPIGASEQNVTMTPSGGLHTFTIPGQAASGTVQYRIYAVDAMGTAASSEEYSVAVRARPSAPAFDAGSLAVALWILAAVVVLATGLAAAAFVATRRVLRRQDQIPKQPPES